MTDGEIRVPVNNGMTIGNAVSEQWARFFWMIVQELERQAREIERLKGERD